MHGPWVGSRPSQDGLHVMPLREGVSFYGSKKLAGRGRFLRACWYKLDVFGGSHGIGLKTHRHLGLLLVLSRTIVGTLVSSSPLQARE